MTKKILALVMAAILAVTMLTFPAFADESKGVTKNGNVLTITWQNVQGAKSYDVIVSRDGTRLTTISNRTETNATYNTSGIGGQYNFIIMPKDSGKNEMYDLRVTLDYYVETTSTGTNIEVKAGSNGVVATWKAQSGVSSYYVEYSYKDGSSTKNGADETSATSYSFNSIAYSNLRSVKVYIGTIKSHQSTAIATWTNSSSGGNTTPTDPSQGIQAQNIEVQRSGNTLSLRWNAYAGASYYGLLVSTQGGSDWNNSTPSPSPIGNSTYYQMNLNPTYNYVIRVFAYTNTGWMDVGYVTVAPYSSWGTTGLSINRNGNYSYDVSWSPVNGAASYQVTHRSSRNTIPTYQVTTEPRITLSYGSDESWNITVTAIDANRQQIAVVGSATVTPNGVTQNNPNYNFGNSNITGQNCNVSISNNTAYITWSSTGTAPYRVNYYVNDQYNGASGFMTNTTYATMPIIAGYKYTIYISDSYNQQVAFVNFTAPMSNMSNSGGLASNVTKTEIKNLKATPKNSYTTTITWDRQDNVVCYTVMYALLNGAAKEEYVYLNSFDMPINSNKGYQVYVFATTTAGKMYEVGHIHNVPGSEADNTSKGKDYVTNLKATSGNKKVTLSWTAANGASSYTIYYKRATSSKWIKAGSVAKTAVNLNGLTNDVTYNFKVVANGNDSGIATIAPSTTSRTVLAADPDDGDISLDDDLKLTGVSSNSKGSLTASWNSVSGATSYRVYVAEGASSTYKNKGTFTGTSATITGLTSGKTYKVRVVKVPVDGDLKSALQACPYLSVTVK